VLLLTSGAGDMVSAEHTMVDGLIELSDEEHGVRNLRTLRVRKFRGSGSLRGSHAFRISSQGLQIFPRIEAWLDQPSVKDVGHGAKIPSGSETIDSMLHGGICSSSVTAIVGPTGAGKTLFGLQFLSRSSEREPGLMFSFFETPSRLIVKSRAVGHDIEPLLKKGHVDIRWHSQGEHLLDELGYELLNAISTRGVRRLVIDGLGALLESVPDRERIGRFMSCLMNETRARGVATLLIVESAEIVGSNVRMPVGGMSAIVENLVFLRFVEHDATLSRLISITKMRNSGYDERVRELFITDHGLEAGDSLQGFDALITGVPRTQAVTHQPPARARKKK
jgi:circadian clock protein KaiC